MEGIGDRVEALEVADVKVRLRAGIDAGNWRQRGDQIFAAFALSEKPVVLAIDELPILINRLLKGHDYRITPDRRKTADQFLSWLRKNGQTHRGRVSMIVSGSVGLEPILKQAGLSAQANIFSPFELRPWSMMSIWPPTPTVIGSFRVCLKTGGRPGTARTSFRSTSEDRNKGQRDEGSYQEIQSGISD